jgi:hypothetical protein
MLKVSLNYQIYPQIFEAIILIIKVPPTYYINP